MQSKAFIRIVRGGRTVHQTGQTRTNCTKQSAWGPRVQSNGELSRGRKGPNLWLLLISGVYTLSQHG